MSEILCPTCHAVIDLESSDLHHEWHARQDRALDQLRALVLDLRDELRGEIS